ncbi:hypothetical protein BH20ACT6_BH20ACT6_12130 [soil metagenome]
MENESGQPFGAGVHDLGWARLDTDRHRRTGDPEVVLGTGKSPDQVVEILATLGAAHPERAVLATRLSAAAVAAVRERLPDAEVDMSARAATIGPLPSPIGTVCVVTAGTSDLPVAAEAALTARVFGAGVSRVSDVGVAGLHRLLDVRDTLEAADCLVVVAGMEGALPSVVGGLVGVPLVAVPTSVGYGASLGGVAALLGMLNSCAPGVTVVNIDNGFGAGVFAARVARGPAAPSGRPDHDHDDDDDGDGDGDGAPSGAPGRTDQPATRIGWVDASSGVSGDMLLGALVDAGVSLAVVQAAVDAASPTPVRLRPEQVQRGGLRALRMNVEVDAQPAEGPATPSAAHRTWANVRALLEAAPLLDPVRDRALATFGQLADAEAAVHGTDPERVHFHEVGALDAIADIVGVCAGLHELGLDRLVCAPVAVGGGRVDTRHGDLPVPVPAVTALLTGAPTVGGPVDTELATPTGTALLATAVDGWGAQPAMSVDAIGVGAGGREHPGHPNVLRLLLGGAVAAAPTGTAAEAAPATATRPVAQPAPERHGQGPGTLPLLLQTNVDDLDPRLWPGVLNQVIAAGASDAWLTPILMKKGRPAHTLSVLVRPETRAAVERVVFAETSTIGLRVQEVNKVALDRSELVVQVHGHPVRVKSAMHDGRVVNLQPEYEDVLAVARSTGLPTKTVLADAAAACRDVER